MPRYKAEPTFRIVVLPLISRIYLKYRNLGASSSRLNKLKSFALGRFYRLLLRVPLASAEGGMEVNVKGTYRKATFNGNNLQFRALYMPVYKSGYEKVTVDFVSALAQQKAVLLDIGSNWGYFSIYVAAQKDFNGRVYAFEPNPVARKDLEGIATQTGLDKVITILPYGLGSEASQRGISSDSLVHTGRTQLTDDSQNVMKVEIKRLDDVAIPKPDIIKLDAEGMELEILRGAQDTLKAHKPVLIFESWADLQNPFHTAALFHFLENLGYAFYVPSLVFKDEYGPVDVQMDATCASLADKGQTGVLRLVRIEPQMRPLLQTHLNLVACHKDKIEDVEDRLKTLAQG